MIHVHGQLRCVLLVSNNWKVFLARRTSPAVTNDATSGVILNKHRFDLLVQG